MCGSLSCSLRSLPALVPTWCIRNTSTAAALLWQREFFCCAGFASCHPAGWILFVTPLSSSLAPLGLGSCVRCSTYVVVQPHQTIFNTDSRDVAYQPLVRCVGYRRQHSLRGRFAPTALGLSSSVLGRTAPVLGQSDSVIGQSDPVLGQSDSVIGQSGPVLGQSDSVIGQSEPVLRYYEKWIRKNIMLNPVFEFRPPTQIANVSIIFLYSLPCPLISIWCRPLLTGYSRNGRFISNQRGNINTVTMPFIAKYSPLEIFQK